MQTHLNEYLLITLKTGKITIFQQLEKVLQASTGTWVAKYPGALGDALTVSFCPASDSASAEHFSGWAYANQFDGKNGTSSYASSNGASNDEIHVVVVDLSGAISGTPNSVLEKFANFQ